MRRTCVLIALLGCDSRSLGGEEGLLDRPAEGYQINLDTTVGRGEEQFRCLYFQPSADEDIDVVRWQSRYSDGSHHLLVYLTDLTALPVQGIHDCGADMDESIVGIAFGAQTTAAETAYPQGVAMHIGAGAVLLLQTHYIDTDLSGPFDATATVNLHYAAPGSVEQEAGVLFFYTTDFSLAAGVGVESSTSLSCPIPSDIQLLDAFSHMHRRGVGFQAYHVGSAGQGTLIYQTDDWVDPAPARYQPPMLVRAGDRVEFSCLFINDRDAVVTEGSSAESNEMCIFVGSYYPRLDPFTELCFAAQLHGSAPCGVTLDCVLGCGSDTSCTQDCLSAACPGAADELGALSACVETNGKLGCSAELAACENSGC